MKRIIIPTMYSRYMYVELIDARDTLVSRIMIRRENELFYGHLYLPEIIPEGNYTLRAYTRHKPASLFRTERIY